MARAASGSAALRKLWRSARLYGARRAYVKALGRLDWPLPAVPWARDRERDVLLAGCGQFGFATISFFLAAQLGNRFAACFDTDRNRAERTRRAYRYAGIAERFEDLLQVEGGRYLYIASNHASHAEYAIAGLRAGKSVYVEKPIAVDLDQLARLWQEAGNHPDRIYCGYNRPFSRAVELLRGELPRGDGPMTLSCFIAGHVIAEDHWYRDPREGTRVCGNLGHWLDLAVHLVSLRDLPDEWRIQIAYSNRDVRDDDLGVSLCSESGDLVTLTLTARAEPFEGINESISLQHGDLMAKIDDFRRMTLWRGERRRSRSFRPKDVGHRRAILQPFDEETAFRRDFEEVVSSSLLTLCIADMVRAGECEKTFSFRQARQAMERAAKTPDAVDAP